MMIRKAKQTCRISTLWSAPFLPCLVSGCTSLAVSFYPQDGFVEGSRSASEPDKVAVHLGGASPSCSFNVLGTLLYDALRDGIFTSKEVAIKGTRAIAARLGASGIFKIETYAAGTSGVAIGIPVGGGMMTAGGSGTEYSLQALAYACEEPKKPPPSELLRCDGRKVRAPDGVHCCWPGQTWSRTRQSCLGIPARCPPGMTVKGRNCEGSPLCFVDMAYIPRGTFGSLATKESVDLAGFCMDLDEVTVARYRECVSEGNCQVPTMAAQDPRCNYSTVAKAGREDHPVNCVTAEQADAYCHQQGKRLPSGHEWEWAARSAGQRQPYPWGSEEPGERLLCWRFSGGQSEIHLPAGS